MGWPCSTLGERARLVLGDADLEDATLADPQWVVELEPRVDWRVTVALLAWAGLSAVTYMLGLFADPVAAADCRGFFTYRLSRDEFYFDVVPALMSGRWSSGAVCYWLTAGSSMAWST
jgi:hypothetical protein